MAFCENCGTELRNGSKFCHKCGLKNESLKSEYVPSDSQHGTNNTNNALKSQSIVQTQNSFDANTSKNSLFDKIRDKFMEYSLPIRLLIIILGSVIVLLLGKYACIAATVFLIWLLSMTIIRARKDQRKVAWWKYLAYGYGIMMFLGLSSVDTYDMSNSGVDTPNTFASSSTEENLLNSSIESDGKRIPSWVAGDWYGYAYNRTIQMIIHYDNSYQFIFGSDHVTGKLTWYDRKQGIIHAEETDGGTFFKVDENMKRISPDSGKTWMQKR